jgi:hypothetical protein
MINDAMVAKSAELGDAGAACNAILADLGVTGIGQLPEDKLQEVLDKVNGLTNG